MVERSFVVEYDVSNEKLNNINATKLFIITVLLPSYLRRYVRRYLRTFEGRRYESTNEGTYETNVMNFEYEGILFLVILTFVITITKRVITKRTYLSCILSWLSLKWILFGFSYSACPSVRRFSTSKQYEVKWNFVVEGPHSPETQHLDIARQN